MNARPFQPEERNKRRFPRRKSGRVFASKRIMTGVAFGVLLGSPTLGHATGYFGGPIGTHALGRAGAFTARADDLSAAFYNPAGFARLRGTVLQLDNKMAYGTLTFTRQPTWNDVPPDDPEDEPPTNFAPIENEHKWRLPGPLVGVGSNFGLDDFGFALVAYTPSGTADVDYPLYGGQRFMMVRREARMFNATLNAAWSPFENFAVGVSAQAVIAPSIVYALVVDANPSAMGFWPITSPFDMLATLKVADPFTFTTIVGVTYAPLRYLEFGLSGQVIPTSVQARGKLSIVPVNPDTVQVLENADIDPEDAITLSRNGEPSNDVSLTMPLPLTARAGVRYIQHAGERDVFDVELDVVYERWSAVKSFELDTQGLTATFNSPTFPSTPIPISSLNVPKEWRDTITVALGGDYAFTDTTTLRCGGYYETRVAEPDYANVDFPSGAHFGVTAGASVSFGALSLGVAYEYRHMLAITTSEREGKVLQLKPAVGDNPEAEFPVVNAGDYGYASHHLALSGVYRF